MASKGNATVTQGSQLKWDGSPTTKYNWFEQLEHLLDAESSSFRTLWERGYVLDNRARVLTSSTEHSAHLQLGYVKTHTFDNPNICGTFTASVPDDADDLNLDELEIDSRYVVAVEVLREKDRYLFSQIAKTISNNRRCKDYETASGGSGTRLLKLLAEEIKLSSAELAQYVSRKMAALVEAGISAPTVSAFDTFRENYHNLNNQLPTARRLADPVIADVFVSAAFALGDTLHTRIELLLQQSGGHGDLELTVKSILDVLGKQELSAVGQAYRTTDPKRSITPRTWIEGKDQPCTVCDGKIDGGRHLRIHCPSQPKTDKPREKETKGHKPGAKMAAGKLYPDLDSGDALTESECRLADLFASELEATAATPTADQTESRATGSAHMAKGTEATDHRNSYATPTSAAPAHQSSPPTTNGSSPSVVSALRRLQDLSATSPMKEIKEVEAELQTKVTMRTGGTDHRSRRDIVNDMRAAIGLPQLPVPTGIPTKSTDAALTTKLEPTYNPTPEHANTPIDAKRWATPHVTLIENPLGMIRVIGCPNLTNFCVGTNSDGDVVHTYTFADALGKFASYSFVAPSPEKLASAPPNSRLIGASLDETRLFWGTPEGVLIECDSNPRARATMDKPTQPTERPSPNAVAGTSTAPSRGSPVKDAALAIIGVIGALTALTVAGGAPSQFYRPHEPGESARQRTQHSLIYCALFLLLCAATKSTPVRQAKPGRGRHPLGATPEPPLCRRPRERWSSIYSTDQREAWRNVDSSFKNRAAPWRLLFDIAHWLVVRGLCVAAARLGLRVSTAGNHRLMLYWRPHRCVTASADIHSAWLLLVRAGLYLPTALRRRTGSSLSSSDTTCAFRCPRDETHVTPSEPLHGRALMGRQVKHPHSTQPRVSWRTSATTRRWLRCVIDSGSTWHVHNRPEDLINPRPCADIVEDAAGNPTRCESMGELLLLVKDVSGKEFNLRLRDVRCSRQFADTLISVDQLWKHSHIDCRFRDVNCLVFTSNRHLDGEPLMIPFQRSNGLFQLSCAVLRDDETHNHGLGTSCRLKPGLHAPSSTSHLSSIPADHLATVLHRRLHIGEGHMRALSEMSADVPPHIAAASHAGCEHCASANATRLPHSGDLYSPTHAGRLVHGDVAGPFTPSHGGGYRYCMILTDDHTRYKWIYFMHKRSDANKVVRKFLSSFKALANKRTGVPIQPVGAFHSDNGGELISSEFTELLDSEGVHHTTCPPYTHQLNGVAERSIRSTFSLVRSYLASSNLSPAFWTYAAEMAIDVQNKTSGPSHGNGGVSSHELLVGSKPKVLNILPFGCRAFAVKPREQYNKTTIEPRAWIGTNLGRSSSTPSSYRIWVPSTGRVVLTSDVYFMEHIFPHRPKGFQIDDLGAAIPTRVPQDDETEPEGQPVTPEAERPRTGDALVAIPSIPVVRGPKSSKPVLILFSGPYNRPDGLAALIQRRGVEVVAVDNHPTTGRETDDLLNDQFFSSIYLRAKSGEFSAVFAAPPCSTYSVSRYFSPNGKKPGPPPVRDRANILGLPSLPAGHQREVMRANEITRRTALILIAAHKSGAEFALENPADRGDPGTPLLFQFPEHGPLWLDPNMQNLARTCHTSSVTFAQCMLGGASQKYTTMWFTAGLSNLHNLRHLICSHAPGAHESTAGGQFIESDSGEAGHWNSSRASAYPAELNLILADAIVDSLLTTAQLRSFAGHSPVQLWGDDPVQRASEVTEPPAARVEAATPPPDEPEEETPTASDAGPSDDANVVDPPVKRTYRRRDPSEFARGLGEIRTRSRTGFGALARRSGVDPANHREAMQANPAGWGQAEAKEIANHNSNRSWSYIPRDELPRGRRIVKFTWVYKTKRSGELKARLCVQGCTQVAGVDYDQTFCAAMRAGSLRVLCAIASRLGLTMRRWDFVAAYLQGNLEPGEVVYCSPPPGYATKQVGAEVQVVPSSEGDGVERLCRVERPIYGMAQAGRRWQRTIFPWLLEWSFDGARLKQSEHDSCVFFCRHTIHTPSGDRPEWLYLGCYVDDLFILSSHSDEHSLYAKFTHDLSKNWEVEDEGEVSDLLSIEISAENSTITLRQTRYIEKMMATYAPDGVPASDYASTKLKSHQPSRTPCGPELPQLVADALTQSADDIDPALLRGYQSLVGALLYAAVNTRPDVAYAVGMLCRAMGKPSRPLVDAAYRVLFYLHHHRHIGLRYSACQTDLSGMSDADWSAHYSTSGYVFQFSQAAISWGSKKQQSVALSSCEAEIMALSESAKEGVYLSRFLTELGFPPTDSTQIFCDNTAARDLAYNPEHHERTKHIERRHFFIRDLVEEGSIVVPFVATTSNMADFFTKPLSAPDFYRHRNIIMNVPDRDGYTTSRAGGC